MILNPFIWTDAIKDGVARGNFTSEVALMLKGGTHVALFGARGIGKTTFLGELRNELACEQQTVPAWELIAIDLRRAISLSAFSGAIASALAQHPSRRARRHARALTAKLEKELGVNFGVIKAGVRSTNQTSSQAEIVHAHLEALAGIADHVVVAFDEFQRLNSCPGEPLSLIRSALMGPTKTGRVSLLLTGSLRERLELMLHTSTEPIWDQTHDLELPDLDRVALTEYLEQRFEKTNKPIEERAVENLVELTNGHPKRSQQLAWRLWANTPSKTRISSDDVTVAFEMLLDSSSPYTTDFDRLIDTFLQGNQSDINNARALFLIASGVQAGSDQTAKLYGLHSASSTHRALLRLKERGLVTQNTSGQWHISDPLLAAWLRQQNPLKNNAPT